MVEVEIGARALELGVIEIEERLEAGL